MSIHNPERLLTETFAEYQDRRKASQIAVKAALKGIPVAFKHSDKKRVRKHPFNGTPKFAKVRTHKPKDPIKATWPKSDDQKLQSRPVIVVHPIRAMAAKFLAATLPDENGIRSLSRRHLGFIESAKVAPKFVIDMLSA